MEFIFLGNLNMLYSHCYVFKEFGNGFLKNGTSATPRMRLISKLIYEISRRAECMEHRKISARVPHPQGVQKFCGIPLE